MEFRHSNLKNCPSYSVFSPKCCKMHKERSTIKGHMDTSEWRFEDDLPFEQEKEFDPWKRKMPSTQRKEKCIKEMDQLLERETRKAVLEDIRKVTFEESIKESSSVSKSGPKITKEPLDSKTEKTNRKLLRNLKEYTVESNAYLVLLNRLDEEEGVRTPSIEDKLKLAEDRLRISTVNFCKKCEELIDEKRPDTPCSTDRDNRLLRPEIVQEAFRPKVFDPSLRLRPPQTLSVSEINEKPVIGTYEAKEKKKESRKKTKGILKQGFYLPSNTWFTQEKEDTSLTPEELELLNSTSTKAFIRFLEERKKEPPKVLQEIQKKLQEMKQSGK